MLGGLLLIVPRTTPLGALICLADLTQVFVLNMTYDVPVKLLSFHLLLLAWFLLAPDLLRLADFFLRNRATELPRRRNSSTHVAKTASRLPLRSFLDSGSWERMLTVLGTLGTLTAADVPALYGIWDVEQFSTDGLPRAPLLTDYGRWRRVIFDFPERMAFQRMDNSFTGYGVAINVNDKTLALTKYGDKYWKADFHFMRPAENH